MGYLLFERKESDEIGATLPEVQQAVKDYGKFALVMKLKAQLLAPGPYKDPPVFRCGSLEGAQVRARIARAARHDR